MTRRELQQVVEALRDRAQKLSAINQQDRIARVAAFATDSLMHDSNLRTSIVDAAPLLRMHASMANAAVDWTLAEFTRAAIIELLATEPHLAATLPVETPQRAANGDKSPPLVLQLMAASVPLLPLEQMLLAIIAGTPTVIKLASQHAHGAQLAYRALTVHDPELASHIALCDWRGSDPEFDDVFDLFDNIIVFGSDATVTAVTARTAATVTGYGTRVSWGLLPEGFTPTSITFERIALDVVAYEQRGCMAPNCIFTPQGSQRDVARGIATSLEALAVTYPRFPLSDDVAAQQMQLLGLADFTGAAVRVNTARVLVWDDNLYRSSPGGRLVHVVGYDDLAAAVASVPQASSAIGLPEGHHTHTFHNDKDPTLRGARLVPFGRMQSPRLVRLHDGSHRLTPFR